MDTTSMISSLLSAYTQLTAQAYENDSSTQASNLASRLISKRDSDDDGYLTSSDLSELSSDEFSKLDTDGDDKIGSSELTSAFKSQMDNIKLAAQSGSVSSSRVLATLRTTPAAKLMHAVSRAAYSTTTDTGSTSSTPTTTSTGSSSILDVSV